MHELEVAFPPNARWREGDDLVGAVFLGCRLDILRWYDTLDLGINIDFSPFGHSNSRMKRMENYTEIFQMTSLDPFNSESRLK